MIASELLGRANWFLTRTPYRHLRKAALRLANRRTVTGRRRALPPPALGERERRIVDALRAHGYADLAGVLPQDALNAVYDATVSKVASGQGEEKRLNPDKNYWERLLDEDLDAEGRQPAESPFVQLAIDDTALRIAAAYFDEAPLLDYVYLLHSSHRPGPFRVSQLWHKDYDDTQLLKLFVYLTDCEDLADGPFTFLPADISKRIGFSLHSHRSDDDMKLPDIADKAIAYRGKKLSAFMVDTSRCYHMGSRVAEGHQRLLYMAAYSTFPKFNGRATVRFRPTGAETELQRIALTYP